VWGSSDAFHRYAAVRNAGAHLVPRPGDKLPFAGASITVVSANGSTLKNPLPGAGRPNGRCAFSPSMKPDTNENSRSVGIRLKFGRFHFVDLGDLVGIPLFNLFCPNDQLGAIDVFVLPHHGEANGGARPAIVGLTPPRVAVMNNGPTRGGSLEMLDLLHRTAGEDVWQLHRSEKKDARNFGDDHIANMSDATAYWLKVTAKQDGSFSVTNPRTGAVRQYGPRPVGSSRLQFP